MLYDLREGIRHDVAKLMREASDVRDVRNDDFNDFTFAHILIVIIMVLAFATLFCLILCRSDMTTTDGRNGDKDEGIRMQGMQFNNKRYN